MRGRGRLRKSELLGVELEYCFLGMGELLGIRWGALKLKVKPDTAAAQAIGRDMDAWFVAEQRC
jgi:hypothetical protein